MQGNELSSARETAVGPMAAPTSTGEPAGELQTAEGKPAAAVAAVRKPALPALTGLRTWLALSIVLFHFTPAGLRYLYPIIDSGYVFVSFFFLISGYILAYNYLDRPGGLNVKDFWVARLSRLYPVYLLSLLLFWEFLQVEWKVRPHGDFWLGTASSLLLMQGFFPTLATFWNTVTWTLSCEIVLYAIFPWLMRVPWPVRPWKLVALVVAFWMVGMTPHVIYMLHNPDHLPQLSNGLTVWMQTHGVIRSRAMANTDRYSGGWWIELLKYTPGPYLLTFLAGISLGKLQSVLTISSRQRMMVALVGFAAGWVTFYKLMPHLPYIMIHGGLLTPVFATIIIGLSGPHPVSSFFAWKPWVEVGSASYCLYLLHFNTFILIHLHKWPERLHVQQWDPWVSYVFVIALAVAARRWVEHPCQKWIGDWWKRRKAAQAGAA